MIDWKPYSSELYEEFCSKRGVWAVWWWSSTEEWIYSQAFKICPQIIDTQLPNIKTEDHCWILNSSLTPFSYLSVPPRYIARIVPVLEDKIL